MPPSGRCGCMRLSVGSSLQDSLTRQPFMCHSPGVSRSPHLPPSVALTVTALLQKT